MARKEDVLKDQAARNVINQVDSKVIQRPLKSTGLSGDQIPSDVLTFDDMDRIKSNIRMEEGNVEAINLLNSLLDQAGMTSSGLAPIRGSMQTKTQALTDNAVSYVDFGPGVWHVSDIVVQYTGGSGTINFRAYAYDATDGNPALELIFASTTSATAFTYNSDAQFDHFQNQFWGETINNGSRTLGLKPNGTFDAGTMTAFILCHRVR